MQFLLDNCSLITEEWKKLNGCFSNFCRVCQVVIAVREKQALNPTSIRKENNKILKNFRPYESSFQLP